jgi:hemerythrin-like domain-containing protein
MATSQPRAYSKKSWEAVSKTLSTQKRSEHPVLATLHAEHRYMATLLKLADEQLQSLLDGDESIDSRVLYESLHYMTHYPDAFHHPREDMVYQRAGELDQKLADDVDTLQREHDFIAGLGAKTLQKIVKWQNGEISLEEAVAPAREYIDALYGHMNAEEKLVFPQIEKLLTDEDWRSLEQEDLINPVADPVFGPKVGREYRNIARKARRALRRGVEDVALVEWVGLEAVLEGVEVLSMALDSSRGAAREHFEAALEETGDLIDSRSDNGGLLLLPWHCAKNNGGRYVSFLKDIRDISKDTFSDLSELGKGTRERLQLIREPAPSDSRH